jgi:hypothetical protein
VGERANIIQRYCKSYLSLANDLMWLLASSGEVLIRYPCLASRAETFAMSLRGKADFVSDCRDDERKSVRQMQNILGFCAGLWAVECKVAIFVSSAHPPHSFMPNPSPDHRSSFPAWPDDGGPNQRKGIVIRIVEMQRFWSRTAKQSVDNTAICRQQNHPVALLSVMRFSKIFWIWLLMYKIFLISNILHLNVHRLVDAPSPHLHLKLPPLTHPSGR